MCRLPHEVDILVTHGDEVLSLLSVKKFKQLKTDGRNCGVVKEIPLWQHQENPTSFISAPDRPITTWCTWHMHSGLCPSSEGRLARNKVLCLV